MSRILTMRKALSEAFVQVMEEDPTVIMMGEDIAGGQGAPGEQDAWGGDLGITKGLIGRFGPHRVLDTPISETAYIGAAVGAATAGLRPIAELMFVDFMGVCFDQLLNQAAKFRYMFGGKTKTPLVIRTQIGAGFRAGAQHSQALYPMFAHIPGLKCVIPSTAYDAKGLMIASVRDDDPVIFFEHKVMYDKISDHVPHRPYEVPLGEANVVVEGDDVTIVAIGRMVHLALEAAKDLAARGISCELIDPRTISPLDEETILDSVRATGRCVVVDEAYPRCGIAADIASIVAEKAFAALKAPVVKVTPPHTPIPFAPNLEDTWLPTPQKISKAVAGVMEFRR
jgi:acetoin:2,6-dichlorophenolindophenol oxidoreductase subunit beta